MTPKELAEIDAWLDDLEPGCDGFYIKTGLVRAMRDEVERLQAREAALLEIVRAASMAEKIDLPELRDKARALLTGDSEREEKQP